MEHRSWQMRCFTRTCISLNTIHWINIIWNEFVDMVPQSSARELAIKLQPFVEPVFAKYLLSDDFAYSAEYEQLYTELTGESCNLVG